jgi:hypothetical protein
LRVVSMRRDKPKTHKHSAFSRYFRFARNSIQPPPNHGENHWRSKTYLQFQRTPGHGLETPMAEICIRLKIRQFDTQVFDARCSIPPNDGGGERDRTDDLLLAKQVLSQLSYAPDKWWAWVDSNYRPHAYQACALTN